MEHLRGAPDTVDDGLLLPGEELSASRRSFLRLAGFGVASGVLAGCSRGPERSVVPLLHASDALVPGRGYAIATTCAGCSAGCGVLARCRDGRPIGLAGNPEHALSRGGLCAVGQADILGLYDSRRAGVPRMRGADSGWEAALAELRGALEAARREGKAVRVLTGTLTSPSTRRALEELLAGFPDARHVEQDALSSAAWLDACEATHGVRALPGLRLERARRIVAVEADFLGTWISPVEHAAAYAAGRDPATGPMSRHVHCEAGVSLTGLAADARHVVAPWQARELLRLLCAALEAESGTEPRAGRLEGAVELVKLARALAAELREAGRGALVLYGGEDEPAARLCNYANALLGAWGETLSLARPSRQRRGDDRAVERLWSELDAGRVGVLLCAGANPAYAWPREARALLERADVLAVHSAGLDETWALADVALPAAHALESWDDAEPQPGRYSLTQPTVPPLRDARTLRWVARALAGATAPDAHLLREHWRDELHATLAPDEPFEAFWRRSLHDGWVEASGEAAPEPAFDPASIAALEPARAPSGLGLVLYPKVGLRDGAHAHNPWLQELPDPVTKVVWDNYACLAPGLARELGVETGDRVRVTAEGGGTLELPALVQRGQHEQVVAIALGYGRAGTERFADVGPQWWEARETVDVHGRVGVNAAELLAFGEGRRRGEVLGVRVERGAGRRDLAQTQEHHSLVVPEHLAPPRGEVRDVARSVTLAGLGHAGGHAAGGHGARTELWADDHAPVGHHWGLAIDLSRCTGCSACVIGCQSENNVPVVGRDEALRHREMHWLRIDRYYDEGEHGLSAAHQPMMCQQCDHAPCESVCPVLATVHSSEGLNQQVYNRCVGTRYCANTCPYKVRRFNWFDYPREDRLQNQALNPDVTVRSRGVMEKCSFCAQRIVEAKARARSEGRTLADGDVVPACQQSCPTQAIVFGDMNDPHSRLRGRMQDPRAYAALEELNVQPSVRYLMRVLNRTEGEASHG